MDRASSRPGHAAPSRPAARPRKRRSEILPGRLLGWDDDDPRRVLLRFERVLMEVSIGVEGAVRVRAGLAPALAADPSEALGREPWSGLPLTVFERGGCVRVGCVAHRRDSVVEILPAEPALRLLEEGRVTVTLDRFVFDAGGAGAAVEARFDAATAFYGFGEKAGPLDKRGRVLRMRNRDSALRHDVDPLYAGIPFFVAAEPPVQSERQDLKSPPKPQGARACGLLLDGFATSLFDVARADAESVRMKVDAGSLDVFLFPGPSPAQVLRGFTALTGRTPLPPQWALGHHQSRWSYGSEAELRSVAARLRSGGVPSDVLHLDIDFMDGFRVFTWDRLRFPNPVALIRELGEQGFRVVTIVDPGVKVDPGYAVYDEGLAKGYFCCRRDGSLYTLRVWPGEAVLPDFNRSEVRRWWAARHEPLLRCGVSGIWNDMNEPAGWQRDLRLGRLIVPTRTQDMRDVVQADPVDETRTRPHEEVRNLYGFQECRATRAALETAREGERPFVLSRSGFTGIQRYAALWTGDNASRWKDLRASIPMLLGLSLSGVPFCGADIGGFVLSCTSELYARWIQVGALSPFSRTHSMWLGRAQDPCSFGPRVERIAREALLRRMRLMPYLYGLFAESEANGAPIWRPLFYEFPEDERCYHIDDQFLLGPCLLVAPVMEKRARQRSVYFPPGTWTGLEDGVQYEGGTTVTVAAPLDCLPLFVRTPGLLPTRSAVQHWGEKPGEALILEVFASAASAAPTSATCALYEDDGLSSAYRQGLWARTGFRVQRGRAWVEMQASARDGAFPIEPRPVRVVFRGAGDAGEVRCDGAAVAWTDAPSPEGPWARRRGADLDVGYLDDGGPCHLRVDLDPSE